MGFCKPCDGYGVVVNKRTGITERCPACGGRRMSNTEVKAARTLGPRTESDSSLEGSHARAASYDGGAAGRSRPPTDRVKGL
jgi:DnaJ-class molecular chaperone